MMRHHQPLCTVLYSFPCCVARVRNRYVRTNFQNPNSLCNVMYSFKYSVARVRIRYYKTHFQTPIVLMHCSVFLRILCHQSLKYMSLDLLTDC
jgi:hypothetical protein